MRRVQDAGAAGSGPAPGRRYPAGAAAHSGHRRPAAAVGLGAPPRILSFLDSCLDKLSEMSLQDMAVDGFVHWVYPVLLFVLNTALVFAIAVSLATFFYFTFVHEYLPGKRMVVVVVKRFDITKFPFQP